MADITSTSERRFYTPGSGELLHNSIHDRNSNYSSSHDSHHGSDSDNEHRQQQQERQQQQTPTLRLQKPSLAPENTVAIVAVQVADRLRWWRTRRVREQPLPVHHYVFRGNYANYSSFGMRPLAPGVTRLLQNARRVRTQYQQHQRLLQRQQLLHRGMSAARNSIGDTGLSQLSQPQLSREGADPFDNKRVLSPVASAPAAATASFASPSDSTNHFGADGGAQRVGAFPADSAPPASMVAPLHAPAAGPSIGSASVASMSCPTEKEAYEAERLLRLYQPRAASLPVRSRRQRRVASYDRDSASVHQRGEICGVEEVMSQSIHLAHAPTSDDMAVVSCAAVAADCAVVLHHEPRLIIYGRGVNPREALRSARVSSEALENLCDAAMEDSAAVCALTSLPLSGFERFFYQQQLCEGRQDVTDALPAAVSVVQDSDSSINDDAPHADVAFSASNTNEGGGSVANPLGDGVVNREDTLCFGSPMRIISAVPSLYTQALVLPTSAGTSAETRQLANQQQNASNCTVERRRPVVGRGCSKAGGARHHRQRALLRAISVPCLPRVYRSGYPQLLSPDAAAPVSAETSSSAPTVAETPAAAAAAAAAVPKPTEGHSRSRTGQCGGRRYLLPSALRSGARPQDEAHMCHRVDDLQDVYVFHPLFDMIGKGAFSKVYAAVPILRGRDGIKRFGAVDYTSITPTTAPSPRCADGAAGPAQKRERKPALPMPATPFSSSHALSNLHPGVARGDAAAPATTVAPAATSPRSVPIVALKVIPRKAREREQKASVDSPTLPAQAQRPPPHHEAADANNSVRRELVEIEREISILRRLHHTGCSHFYEALRSPDAFAIAMRVYPGSMDARHYLSRYGPPSEARTAVVLFQLVSTVQYLHTSFGLIHRDIKLENLLFSEVDSSVSNAGICEVLGHTVHKADPAAAATHGSFSAERPTLASSLPPDGSRAEPPVASRAHEALRLLRVTLIDFGLARRTRAAGMPPNMPRIRIGGAHNQSLSASMNSPANAVSGFSGGSGATNGCSNAFYFQNSNVQAGASVSAVASSPASAAQHQQQPSMQTPGGMGTAMTTFTGIRSANNSYSSMPAMPPPLFPQRLCRSPSTAAHSTVVGPGTSRVGMPSPMPSTANMLTRFLDLDEDLDEEESILNGVSANGFTGAAATNSEMVSGHFEASVTSPQTTSSSLQRGSRAGLHEEESAVSSTDISASETDFDSDYVDDGELENARNEPAASGEPETIATVAEKAGDQSIPTPTRMATAQAVLPLHPPSDGSSQTVMGGGGGGTTASTANSPSAQYLRLPPSQYFSLRDDTEATLLLTPCGTEKYLPPEVLSWVLEHGWTRRFATVGLARAMDMYAIGIVAYVLLSGCFPFNASSRATLLQQQQRVPRCNSARWSGVSSEAIAFVQRLLEPNPLKRMTAREALGHPFLLGARPLAEKLSLVPHGEGEEMMRSSDDGCCGDAQFAHRFNSASGSVGDNSNNLCMHGLLSGNSAVRARWSTNAARGFSQQPLTAFADRGHSTTDTSPAAYSGANGGHHCSPSLASPERGGSQPAFGVPGRSAFAKLATHNVPLVTASAAATATAGVSDAGVSGPAAAVLATGSAATPPRKEPVTTVLHSSNNGETVEATFLRSAGSVLPDMFAALAQEVLESSRPPPRDSHHGGLSPLSPHSLSSLQSAMIAAPSAVSVAGANSEVNEHLLAARRAASSVAKSAQPATTSSITSAMKSPVNAANGELTAPPKASPAHVPAGPPHATGGADDLFESLYHNIMLSD
ncbi:putative Protein kinase [Leptomonas seymouri]|uniref:Protein kinase domain-containing protein n=1 Tax=Leptomonas seymouri TaxID=5684 RepID=A0A0N1I3W8_LEPSE|nr:putative Protein kinase [Leptomonas seymouri]|eukprot:KPI84872.1 putative Protein kinase [Leptomonas seymouri]